MRHLLVTTLLLSACQGGPATPVASASPIASPVASTEPVATTMLAASPVTDLLSTPSPVPLAYLPSGTVSIAGHPVAVAIAATPESRRQGLSGRKSLAADTGLVLAWQSPAVVSIWMPDMNFPIDVIFVREGHVLAVYPDAQPCVPGQDCPVFGPTIPVDFVLEVPAGSAKAWGVTINAPASYKANQ